MTGSSFNNPDMENVDQMLSYICTTDRPESEEYLIKVLEEIKNQHKVSITNNRKFLENSRLSEEIIIDFEEC